MRCTNCNIDKSPANFYPNHQFCKSCKKKKEKLQRDLYYSIWSACEIRKDYHLDCKRCKRLLPNRFFSRDTRKFRGFKRKCKICMSEEYFNKHLIDVEVITFEKLKCCECKKIKSRDLFNNSSDEDAIRNRGGKCYLCIECVAKRRVEYYSENKELVCKRAAEYRQKTAISLICMYCGKNFTRCKHDVDEKTFCSRKCYELNTRGKNHHKWIKDRSKLKDRTRSFRESAKMNDWRLAIYRRDYFRCQECGSKKKLNAHHIVRVVDDELKSLDMLNGICLCEKCHKKTYHKERLFEQKYSEIALRNSVSTVLAA